MFRSTFAEVETRYRAAIAADIAIEMEVLDRVETRVIPEQPRAGSNLAVAYHIGCPTLIRTDPKLAPGLEQLASAAHASTSDELRRWTGTHNWEFVDGGDQHVISSDLFQKAALPDGARLVSLDRGASTDRDAMAELFNACDPDDVDAAEFELDDLDPHIVGLVDTHGRLMALASGREWGSDSAFDDIGVLTHSGCRRGGWGAAVVSAFCTASLERDRLPLYRCNWDRVASKALALKLGFQLVGHLSALRPMSPA